MNSLSIFDVIGPNMIGPSSSHTAGACAIALMARRLFDEDVKKVTFTLYGSFSKTYQGHGTDKALLGGVLGFATDDPRIRNSFELAKERGVEVHFIIDEKTQVDHPNTADILMEGADGKEMFVRGVSTGGGKMRIVRINQIDVDFTGEYTTLIVKQFDKPGVVAHITKCLADEKVNIAFLRLFREDKGANAFTVVETDERIPQAVLEKIKKNENIQELMLIPM